MEHATQEKKILLENTFDCAYGKDKIFIFSLKKNC
jgi:hypothetical protein